jgi:hypothetical protein
LKSRPDSAPPPVSTILVRLREAREKPLAVAAAEWLEAPNQWTFILRESSARASIIALCAAYAQTPKRNLGEVFSATCAASPGLGQISSAAGACPVWMAEVRFVAARKQIYGRYPRCISGCRHLSTCASRMPAGALAVLLFCGFSACLTAVWIRARNRTFTCGMSTFFRIFFQVDFLSTA